MKDGWRWDFSKVRFVEFVLENKSTGIKVWMKSLTCSSDTNLLSAAAAIKYQTKMLQLAPRYIIPISCFLLLSIFLVNSKMYF